MHLLARRGHCIAHNERACARSAESIKAALLKRFARGDAQLLQFKAIAVGHGRFFGGGAGSIATLGG